MRIHPEWRCVDNRMPRLVQHRCSVLPLHVVSLPWLCLVSCFPVPATSCAMGTGSVSPTAVGT